MPKKDILKYSLALLWFGIVIIQLIHTTIMYFDPLNKNYQAEILLGHALPLLFLSAPLGWLAIFCIGNILSWLGVSVMGIWDAVFMSITCGVTGYIQWFILLPWLWKKRGVIRVFH
jgi:hypothetical protein